MVFLALFHESFYKLIFEENTEVNVKRAFESSYGCLMLRLNITNLDVFYYHKSEKILMEKLCFRHE
jgi:hypothetical protein